MYGETPSLETGPAKAFEGSRYAYIESTGIDPYSRASLEGIVQLPKGIKILMEFSDFDFTYTRSHTLLY